MTKIERLKQQLEGNCKRNETIEMNLFVLTKQQIEDVNTIASDSADMLIFSFSTRFTITAEHNRIQWPN